MSVTDTGSVSIRYTDWTGEEREREFFVNRSDGVGYVCEYHYGHGGLRDTPQVCERLACSGSTLMASRETLPDVIRREYRRMRAEERAEERRAAAY